MKNLTYQEIIDQKGMFLYAPTGTSMLPLIREGIDTVKLVKITKKLKKYDVVLYKRANNQFVLHRIVKVNKDGFNMLGDNQFHIEKGVPKDSVIALMDGLFRQDKYISMDTFYLKLYAVFHYHLRVFRRTKLKLIRILKRKDKI